MSLVRQARLSRRSCVTASRGSRPSTARSLTDCNRCPGALAAAGITHVRLIAHMLLPGQMDHPIRRAGYGRPSNSCPGDMEMVSGSDQS